MLLQKWRRIMALRWLLLISLLGGLGVWGYAAVDPTPWRFGVACGYSLLCMVPTFVLYFKRSD
jgi:hypothetical protein